MLTKYIECNFQFTYVFLSFIGGMKLLRCVDIDTRYSFVVSFRYGFSISSLQVLVGIVSRLSGLLGIHSTDSPRVLTLRKDLKDPIVLVLLNLNNNR
jgi:hypothetical protein